MLETHLVRIAAHDTRLSAFITVDADGARRQADACDVARRPIGALHGVPIAVKDLTNTKGLRTTYGSLLFQHNVPEHNELVVARLRQAVAVVIGKTNTPEFGFGAVCANHLCGPTRNPFDPALTSGGSSGGSAVAVATGMAALAHGTDFGGSVRTPASFCDVVSIRPTPGRIPSPARSLGWDMLATHGFLARSIADVEQVSPDCSGAIEAFRTLRAAHVADAYGDLLRDRRAELTPTVIWNIEAGGQLKAQDYLSAERRRTAIYRSFRDLFAHKDFLVAPAASVFPWMNDAGDVMEIDGVGLETPIDYLAVTFIVSLVGFPVLTLPTPRRRDEKPFGVQIIAAPGQEARLFAFGRRIEEQLGFSHIRPVL
ncbi:MAG TPA: amidase [Tardiphaga sp.]